MGKAIERHAQETTALRGHVEDRRRANATAPTTGPDGGGFIERARSGVVSARIARDERQTFRNKSGLGHGSLGSPLLNISGTGIRSGSPVAG
jgi:hypothetical protein